MKKFLLVVLTVVIVVMMLSGCGQKWICDNCGKEWTGKAYHGVSTHETMCASCAELYWMPLPYEDYEKTSNDPTMSDVYPVEEEPVYAEEDYYEDDYYEPSYDYIYSINDEGVHIEQYIGAGNEDKVIIVPDTIEDIPVVSVNSNAFNDLNFDQEAYFEIVYYEIVLPETAVFVSPEEDFDYITTADGAVIIGYLGNSPYISVPDTLGGVPVTAIGEEAFWGVYADTLLLPDTVTKIHNSAINTFGIRNFRLSSSITEIGANAINFADDNFTHSTITEVVIPESCKKIHLSSFEDTSYAKDVKLYIPNSIDTIENDTCTIDSFVILSEYDNAFTKFFNEYVGDSYDENIIHYEDENFQYFVKDDFALVKKYIGDSTSATVPDTILGKPVTGVLGEAFYRENVPPVTEIKLSSNTTDLFIDTFYGTELTELTIPGSVRNIEYKGKSLYDHVPKEKHIGIWQSTLTTLVFEEGIKDISGLVLDEHTASIYLPSSAEHIELDINDIPYTTLFVHPGSYAESYAKQAGFYYEAY